MLHTHHKNTAVVLALATLASGGCSSLGSLDVPERDRAAAAERLSGEPLGSTSTDPLSILSVLAERLYPSLRRLDRIEIERPSRNPERPSEIVTLVFDPRGHVGGFEVTFKTQHGEQTGIPLRGTYSIETFEGIDGSSISNLRLSFECFWGAMNAEFSQVQPAADGMWETLFSSPPAVSARMSVDPSLPGKLFGGIRSLDMRRSALLELTTSLPATLKVIAERELVTFLTERREVFGDEESFRGFLDATAAFTDTKVRIFCHPFESSRSQFSQEQLRSHILSRSSDREGERIVYVCLGHPASTPLSRVVAADNGGLWVIDAAGVLSDAFAGRHVAWDEVGKKLSGAPLVSDERLHLTISECGPRHFQVEGHFEPPTLSDELLVFARGVEKAEQLFGLPKGAIVIRLSSSDQVRGEPLPVGVVAFRNGGAPAEERGYASAVSAICFALFVKAGVTGEQEINRSATVSREFLQFVGEWAELSMSHTVAAATILICSTPEAMERLQNASHLAHTGFEAALQLVEESSEHLSDPSELLSLIAFGRGQLAAWRPEEQASRVVEELLRSLEQLR